MRNNFYFILSILLLAQSCETPSEKRKKEQSTIAMADTALTERNACLLSQITYCTDISSVLTTYMPGWKAVWEAKELGGNHAFVATDGKAYALAIRGSLINFSWAAFQNWIYQDLHVVTQEKWTYTNDSSAAKLSQGSFDGWQNLCKMGDKNTGQLLLPFLEATLTDKTPLLITGHSLGGNLATVYASYLWQVFQKNGHNKNHISVITFAAPAAGNQAFAEDFNKKIPVSLRIENTNDIVPKFPNASAITTLGNLYTDSLSAGKVMVGYKNLTVPLSKVFVLLNTAMTVMEYTNGISTYVQTNGDGKKIAIPLSGKNSGNEIINWLSEAGYQHSIAQYAKHEGLPVIKCD